MSTNSVSTVDHLIYGSTGTYMNMYTTNGLYWIVQKACYFVNIIIVNNLYVCIIVNILYGCSYFYPIIKSSQYDIVWVYLQKRRIVDSSRDQNKC